VVRSAQEVVCSPIGFDSAGEHAPLHRRACSNAPAGVREGCPYRRGTSDAWFHPSRSLPCCKPTCPVLSTTGYTPVPSHQACGRTAATPDQVEKDCVSGFYNEVVRWLNEPDVAADLNGDGDMLDLGVPYQVFAIDHNPAGLQIVEYVSDR